MKKIGIFQLLHKFLNQLMFKGTLLRCNVGKLQGYGIAFSEFLNVLLRRNNDFIEFKVHLIHCKSAPLLHNIVIDLMQWKSWIISNWSTFSKKYIKTH